MSAEGSNDALWPDHTKALEALVGRATGPKVVGPDLVNEAMIRHWVEAMGDENPVYVTAKRGKDAGFGGLIAPPTMLQAWTMAGLKATLLREASRNDQRQTMSGSQSNHDIMMRLLDEEGLTAVVATNCEQSYSRPLRPGERISATSIIESLSPLKKTGLGQGRFVTTKTIFSVSLGPSPLDDEGEQVGLMEFRILKYRPGSSSNQGSKSEPKVLRPRPSITEDIAFFFEGVKKTKLLIQRCSSCGQLRHPPLPACPACRSFLWDTVEASGLGHIFSFVVAHYPQVPSFDYPLVIGLVELEEGTRLVAELEGLEPSLWSVGTPVEVFFKKCDEELTLPAFRPRRDKPLPTNNKGVRK